MSAPRRQIFVCMKMKHPDSCGRSGGPELLAAIRNEIETQGLRGDVTVRPGPCLDCCGDGPAVAIYDNANREFSRPPDGLLGFLTAKPRIETALTSERAAHLCHPERSAKGA